LSSGIIRDVKKLLVIGYSLLIFTLVPTVLAASLDQINQKVCDRLEADTSHLAAIMDQLKERKGITETRVAFGGSDTPIKQADYWVNFAAEAIAYQRVQQYSGSASLRSNLQGLAGKVLKAKEEVGIALGEKEK